MINEFPISRYDLLERIEELCDTLEGLTVDDKYEEEAVDLLARGTKVSAMLPYEELHTLMLRLQVFINSMKIDLDYVTIPQLQAMVRQGKLTYYELTRMYLDRIALYNDHTIKINAIRCLNPHALDEAEACDKILAEAPEKAQGLFGMPIIIKDNIGTNKALGMPTTACSVALANNFVEEDAELLKQLRKQGVVLLAKTNLSELANFFTFGVERANGEIEKMPAGYSTLAGQVLSPYKPGVISPAGSSSGSGAGCAAGLATVAIGTETTGSILFPAHANSLVGIKPTLGLISRRGIIPLSHSQDTAGPMTRNVTDAAYLLNGMKCFDEMDVPVTAGPQNLPVTQELWDHYNVDFTQYLNLEGLKGKRLGVFAEPEAALKPFFNKIVAKLEELGAEVIYDEQGKPMENIMLQIQGPSDATANTAELLQLDFALDIQNYLDGLKDHHISLNKTSINTLQDIVNYNKHYPERLLYGQSILEKCLEFDIAPASADMKRAVQLHNSEIHRTRTQIIDALFAKYKLDAIIALDRGTTRVGAIAGYPTITVPAGYREKVYDQHPINLCFTAQAFDDAKLIAMAFAFEQATKARKAPGKAIKAELKALLKEAEVVDLKGRELEEAQKIYDNNFVKQYQVDRAAEKLAAALACWD